MNTKSFLLAGALVLAAAGGAYWALRPAPLPASASGAPAGPAAPQPGDPMVEVRLPDRFSALEQIGRTAFDAVCAACHGPNAAGRQGMGPPLVHPFFRPGHHADAAFQRAVQTGVRAHHWRFGDMPPQEGLTTADVRAIVGYVRALQRANGIR